MARVKYRSVPEYLAQDDVFVALSPATKGVLLVVMINLPHTGMGRIPRGALEVYANATSEQLENALQELEAVGWLARDGTGYLLIHGLKWQSAFAVTNHKHRKAVNGSVAALGSSALVERFYQAYPEWREDHPRHPKEPDAHANGYRMGNEGHAKPYEEPKQFHLSKKRTAGARGQRGLERVSTLITQPEVVPELDDVQRRDALMRNHAQVLAIVDHYRRGLNGKGDAWWSTMFQQSVAAGRVAMAFAYDWIIQQPGYHGPTVAL